MPTVDGKVKTRLWDPGARRAGFAAATPDQGIYESEVETRHNPPSPFTIHQGLHPNPALLGNNETWRLIPDQDEGIA
jgi:hypothetical protein